MSARYRWVVKVHGERLRGSAIIYGSSEVIYFKTINDAEDYAEGMIMSPDFPDVRGDEDIEYVRTIVFHPDTTLHG